MDMNRIADQHDIPLEVLSALELAAIAASKQSYSPYSHFAVGAAILTLTDKVFAGANIENASYGLSNCAERTAIFTAAAQGERVLKAVVIYTPTTTPTSPCGTCLQVINEFGPKALVMSICDSPIKIEATLDQLLPHAFGPHHLK